MRQAWRAPGRWTLRAALPGTGAPSLGEGGGLLEGWAQATVSGASWPVPLVPRGPCRLVRGADPAEALGADE